MIELIDLLASQYGWEAPEDMEIHILQSVESLASSLRPRDTEPL
jgi:hypothetical protein